jgi:hypothetical protein
MATIDNDEVCRCWHSVEPKIYIGQSVSIISVSDELLSVLLCILHTEELHTEELHTDELHTEELHTEELHTEELHTDELHYLYTTASIIWGIIWHGARGM